jgi:NAD(P)-dependent dehydrogenase (short-subunit alcohol dehydrogenase family)/acyl carrier protein
LLLPERGAVRLQVVLGEPEEDGERSVTVFSRLESRDGDPIRGDLDGGGDSWMRHASGVVETVREVDVDRSLGFGETWPPAGASALDTSDAYGRLADMGLDYGPAFQGLQAAWRRGEEIFCEVALSNEQAMRAGSFCMHPALLDAALHALAMLAIEQDEDANSNVGVRLPFSWSDVRFSETSVTSLRIRLSTADSADDAHSEEGRVKLSLVAVDGSGTPAVSVGSLLTRSISPEQLEALRGARHDSLFGVDWTTVSLPHREKLNTDASEWAILGEQDASMVKAFDEAGIRLSMHRDLAAFKDMLTRDTMVPPIVLLDAQSLVRRHDGAGLSIEASEHGLVGNGVAGGDLIGTDVTERVHDYVCRVLAVLQDWLADERLVESQLLVVSRQAVKARPDDTVDGFVQSGIWGLLRSAQSEHPHRFVLIDVDCTDESWRRLPMVAALNEPEIAIREGELLFPRMTRSIAVSGDVQTQGDLPDGNPTWDTEGTVLITGGIGGLGGLVARHLVADHGARRLLIASRRGIAAPGAIEIETELEELGADVQIVSCDVSDRDAVAGLLELIPSKYPLRLVVHAAGVIDDGLIESLTAARVQSVLGAKASAAWHLHELTQGLELQGFVLFSSAAATFGSAGQGNYAAANAFLDSLAAYRRAQGLAGTSIAWGFWDHVSDLTSGLGDTYLGKMARSGVLSLSAQEGLGLFDRTQEIDEAATVAVRLDDRVLRAQARAGTLSTLLSGLVSVPSKRRAGQASLARRLAEVSEDERADLVLKLVRDEVAAALGHATADMVSPERSFKDLGFDSLAAVELRNRLNVISELRLPATLVFDYPNTTALAHHLLGEVLHHGASASVDSELDNLERMLSLTMDDYAERTRITARLQTLLSTLVDTGDTMDGVVSGDDVVQSATDDQLFELIDKEIGAH